jgi:hypothetical protein
MPRIDYELLMKPGFTTMNENFGLFSSVHGSEQEHDFLTMNILQEQTEGTEKKNKKRAEGFLSVISVASCSNSCQTL